MPKVQVARGLMQLNHGLHLAYCTNVHPGENWPQTLHSLEHWTLAVKEKVSRNSPYAIGLRLSDQASRELADPQILLVFQRWLEKHNCYVFTINGFPFGRFHGARVKEQVYRPDWTDPLRLAYTNRLFDLLSQLVPPGIEGSVSTLPGSFKEFIRKPEQLALIRANLWRCVDHIAKLSEKAGRKLHLGLEPEPLGLFENSVETADFFDRLREEHPGDPRLDAYLGVNYDTCHFAVEFEEPEAALSHLLKHKVRLSKIHISNALALRPEPTTLNQLKAFSEDVYLHQVVARSANGSIRRFKDLDVAFAKAADKVAGEDEWRVHFHVPLQSRPSNGLNTTSSHILGLFDILQEQPQLCSHLEMETYTWAVLPETLKSKDVTDQLVAEYDWTLRELSQRGLASPNSKSE